MFPFSALGHIYTALLWLAMLVLAVIFWNATRDYVYERLL